MKDENLNLFLLLTHILLFPEAELVSNINLIKGSHNKKRCAQNFSAYIKRRRRQSSRD